MMNNNDSILMTSTDHSNNSSKCLGRNNKKFEHLTSFYLLNLITLRIKSALLFLINLSRARLIALCLIFVTCITVLTALNHSGLMLRKTAIPLKIFDPSISHITDYELGNLKDLHQDIFRNDASFVMYYAPWDGECIRFKREFELIAKHYATQIHFVAINCWWPDGDCRKEIKIVKFPVLCAYVRDAGNIFYNGPLIASYIIPFLDNILEPLNHLLNDGDLLDLISKHDAVVVGYYEFIGSKPSNEYKQFFRAALRYLANDPWGKVKFSVITNKKLAHKLRITEPNSLTIFFWNSTSINRTGLKKSSDILMWVNNRIENSDKSLVYWLTPSGSKSDTFASLLTANNTFILFTPRSLIFGISPYFDVLREVAMDYFNCDKSPIIRSIIHRSILRRRAMEEKLMEMEEKCHEIYSPVSDERPKIGDFVREDTCCHPQIIRWKPSGKSAEKKCYCTACVHISLSKCPSDCKKFNCLATASRYLNSFEPTHVNSSVNYCNEIKVKYEPKYTPYYKILLTCSGNIPETETNTVNYENSDKSSLNDFETSYCSRLALGLNYSDFNFPESGEGYGEASQSWREGFSGLGCRSNRSLKFVAIDSLLFPFFAEKLGVDVFNQTHCTVGFILEAKQETVYRLYDHPFTKKSMYDFVKNYTKGSLRRWLRSDAEVKSSDCGHICVTEIKGNQFKDVIEEEKDVVLMYYTPWCGFCSVIAHIYLAVAKFFKDVEGIRFVRINGDANDLPFEYTVDRYPTIMFFPAKRKHDSVVYPQDMPITTTSLIKFVLANSQNRVKWQTSFKFCDKKCLVRNWLSYARNSERAFRKLANNQNQLAFVRMQLLKAKRSRKTIYTSYLQYLVKRIVIEKKKIRSMLNLREMLKKNLQEDRSYPENLSKDLTKDIIGLIQKPSKSSSNSLKKKKKKKKKLKDEL